MELKAGYKQTEVGVIPEDWNVRPLSGFGELLSAKRIFEDDYVKVGVPFYRGKEISLLIENKPLDDEYFITNERFDAIRRTFGAPTKGDILITAVGTLGNVYLIPDDRPFYFKDGNVIWLRHVAGINKSYLTTQLRKLKQTILDNAIGSTQKALTIVALKKTPIPLPPTKAEQEAIAEALIDADALIESLEQLIAKKRQIKQGALQELLTGKKRLPGFSWDWEVKTFGEVFTYLPTATNPRSDLVEDGEAYYIHYGDIHTKFHNHLDFMATKPPMIEMSRCRNAALIKNGDWVMADASEDYDGVGKTIEITGLEGGQKAVAGLHTFLLREKSPTFVPGFKGHLGGLKSLHEEYLRVATGMKVYGVSKTALVDLELPVPHPDEQTAIAEILSDMDAEIAALDTKLRKARQMKQGMMQELLTGKIRLTQREASHA